MLRICSLAGETLKTFAAEEFEGQSVKSLKTLIAKQIGVPRFRQRWVSEDHAELQEDSLVSASDVQLVVLGFVQADFDEINELFDACERNLPDTVEKLLRKPFNPDMTILKNEFSQTALHVAARSGSVECLALLLEAGADKDAFFRFRPRRNACFMAPSRSAGSERQLVQRLNPAGGTTALHAAAEFGHLQVVRLLLEAGAKKDVSELQETTLVVAARNGHWQVVDLLRAHPCL